MAGAPLPPPLPVGYSFEPTDEELLQHYSANGFRGLIGIFPYVCDMYLMRPEQIPVKGEGRKYEDEDNGLRTTTTEWLVTTDKFSEERPAGSSNVVWIADPQLVPVRNGNQIVGFNRTIRFFEHSKSFWTAVEVMPPNDQVSTVACRVTKKDIEPIFSMDEEDASLTFDELVDGGNNHNNGDFDW